MSSVTFDLDPCGGRHERCHRSPSSGKTPTYRRSTTRLWSACSTTTDRCRGSAKPPGEEQWQGGAPVPLHSQGLLLESDLSEPRRFQRPVRQVARRDRQSVRPRHDRSDRRQSVSRIILRFDRAARATTRAGADGATTDLTDATPDAMGLLAGYNGAARRRRSTSAQLVAGSTH